MLRRVAGGIVLVNCSFYLRTVDLLMELKALGNSTSQPVAPMITGSPPAAARFDPHMFDARPLCSIRPGPLSAEPGRFNPGGADLLGPPVD